tara:strand:+ start:1188 stop:2072 length:885 start_codon:yes stop_codon:yes gene_type:complete
MIIVDFNGVVIANLMIHLSQTKSNVADEPLIRHMVLNSIRSVRKKFYPDYGEIIIACDDKHYWRKEVFPYYKAHRKIDRKESPYDWNQIFGVLDNIKEELRTFFPYKVIQVKRAEADDIIGVICEEKASEIELPLPRSSEPEKILIVSSDKDFIQLQKYEGIDQWSPREKKFIRHPDPVKYLREHIIKGDRGDGVPNILSSDDTFVTGARSQPIRSKALEGWLEEEDPEEFCDEKMLRNWKRNQEMVDLSLVPIWLRKETLNQLETEPEGSRKFLLDYFIKNKLRNLLSSIGDF